MTTATVLQPAIAPTAANNSGSLAQQFYTLSQALDDFRLAHWSELSPDQRGQLKDEAQALDTRAHYLTADAIGALTASIQPELAAITNATNDAQKTLGNLNKLGNAVAIATAAVALGAAVATGNLASVSTAVVALTDTVASAAAGG